MSSRTYKIVLIALIVWFTLAIAATLIFSDERVLLWGSFVGAWSWIVVMVLSIYKTFTDKDDII